MRRMKQYRLIALLILVVAISLSLSKSQSEPESEEGSQQVIELALIPGGEFSMGREGEGDNSPAHEVHIDSFYIDTHEVTNAQYYVFCRETGHTLPEFWGMEEFHCGPDFPDYPVVGVSWYDAQAYAQWIGKRLPTEAEWEYAARGGLEGKRFPHGDDLDSTLANFASKGTVPVGSYPPNGYGLYDMSGNVVEWVLDYYDKDYYKTSPSHNPSGPQDGKFCVIRGGGWHSGRSCNAVYHRNCLIPSWVDFNVGFRCARDAD